MNDENVNIHSYNGLPPDPRSKMNQSGARSKRRRQKSGRAFGPSAEHSANGIASHLTPAFLLHVFRRWWLVVSPIGILLAVLVAAGLWYSFLPIYKAVAWVQIQDRRPHIAFQGAIESGRFVQTQLELIRSPLVLSSALSRPEVARLTQVAESSNPLSWMSTNVEVKSVGGSDLYQIAFKDADPVIAAKIADAIMDAYLELQNLRTSQQIEEIVRLLEEEKGRRVGELEQLREKVRALYAKVYPHAPTLPPGSKGEVTPAASPMAKEQDQLTACEVDRAILDAKLGAYEKLIADEKIEVPLAMVERAVEDSPEVQKILLQLSTKQADLKEFQRRSAKGAQDPHVQRLANEIQVLEKSLKKERDDLKPRITEELQTAMRKDRDAIAEEMRMKIKSQKVLEGILTDRIITKRQELEKGADRSLELEFARADLFRAETVFKNISDRILMLRTEKEAPSQATMLQRALPPVEPMELLPYKRLGVFGLGAFAFPLLLAALWELRVRRISDPQEIVREVHLEVLGEIAVIPMRSMVPGRRADERFERDCSTFEESIDSLRTSLMLSEELRHLQVFAVASAVSREGKTSLAAQLAISLANCCQQPTLLIDTDMRAPDLHEFFGVSLEPGLAQVLELECSPADALVTTWSNRVHVLPAGRLRNSPHLLLTTPVFGNILQEMRSKYRYIVIDAPPVLAASEAMIVAKQADGTLVCTMRDVSRAAQLKLACDRLTNAGARLLGAVLSGVPVRTYAYKYGGYDYYSKRYRRNDPSIGHSRTLQPPPADAKNEPPSDDA